MSCGSAYDRLDFNEWFIKFVTPHPQLQYCDNKRSLLHLQTILSEKYQQKIYQKDFIIKIYNNYLEKEKKELIKYYNFEQDMKKKIKDYKNITNKIIDKYIEDGIKEL